MRTTLLTFLLLLQLTALCQLTETFNDGNFTANPPWTGNTADWTVNAAQQLQSNNTVANAGFYLSTANTLATTAQWDFWVRLQFNTSSLNYVDVFLTASSTDLSAAATTGYFVRIGGTDDEVSLFRKDPSGSTKIIDGANSLTNNSDNTLRIRVIRDAGNNFTLLRDFGAVGSFLSEGSATDATYSTSAAFGFLVRQSTSSFFQRHYFDDITIQTYVPDVTPPAIQSVTVTSSTTIDVLFSEAVDLNSSQTAANYVVAGLGAAASAQRDAGNNARVHLTFAAPFSNSTQTLTINGVRDVAGNAITNATASFSFFTAQRFDVVISEIMADPTPQVGLPAAEYVELRNVSGREINLQGWRMATATATSGALPAYTLPADSFLILTSTANASQFAIFGRVLGVPSFPTLDNTGTILSLRSADGRLIHAVAYSLDWYRNATKADGGWSLEMIDPKNPCGGAANWNSSTDPQGGTPGRINSVNASVADAVSPGLQRVVTVDNTTLIAQFDEPLDSTAAAQTVNYSMNGIAIISAQPIAPLFQQVQLRLASPLQPQTVYTLTVRNVTDCKGNSINTRNTAPAGLPQEAAANDVVINEILFNPKSGGNDYVEIYNRTNKVIDLTKLFIANRSAGGVVQAQRALSTAPLSMYPGDYIVVTEDAAYVQATYTIKNRDALLQLPTLPSFPDDKGTVVLVNSTGTVVDEVAYDEDWHFALITNPEGVALERIDPNGPSQSAANWQSAASTAGYGTPGYRNSQAGALPGTGDGVITVSPKIFSPNNDGFEDVALISFNVQERGYVANVTVFDAQGRPVRQLVRNSLLGTTGIGSWDGLDDRRLRLPIGTYIIYVELFNLQGRKQQYKHTVRLAR